MVFVVRLVVKKTEETNNVIRRFSLMREGRPLEKLFAWGEGVKKSHIKILLKNNQELALLPVKGNEKENNSRQESFTGNGNERTECRFDVWGRLG